MKIYKDKKSELSDVKSTGWSFCLVGCIGILLLILVNLNIISISLTKEARITITVAMGIMFLAFIVIGVLSFLSIKKTAEKIDSQLALEVEILSWFMDNCVEEIKNLEYNSDMEIEDNESDFYLYSERISQLISSQYTDLPESFLEYMAEKIYTQIFPDN